MSKLVIHIVTVNVIHDVCIVGILAFKCATKQPLITAQVTVTDFITEEPLAPDLHFTQFGFVFHFNSFLFKRLNALAAPDG
jgi:hypothetical protein